MKEFEKIPLNYNIVQKYLKFRCVTFSRREEM